MKKAIGFIILISFLALLDGTPIHNHHGKYISTRSKSSFQSSPESALASLINEEFIADQDENDHPLDDRSAACAEFFQSIHNTPNIVVVAPSRSGNSSVPRYRLACDLRI